MSRRCRRLARLGLVPWPYRPLLEHAADCLLLRRVGGAYLFVHRELMLHLAGRAVSGSAPR